MFIIVKKLYKHFANFANHELDLNVHIKNRRQVGSARGGAGKLSAIPLIADPKISVDDNKAAHILSSDNLAYSFGSKPHHHP